MAKQDGSSQPVVRQLPSAFRRAIEAVALIKIVVTIFIPITLLNYLLQIQSINTRALTAQPSADRFMTLKTCAASCKGLRFFGAGNGDERYCGNEVDSGLTQMCGGVARLSMCVSPSQ
ncbi:hypothetical protein P8C59_004469 [Phyllachora maydis]|uniref:Uncharacterized protein n=1 Tax=Phyllachora maydis TaxID=1825666 RepID=A0AAD9I2T6_9PEZI|nr:hypothetical protein P8C59_004469 [Phyllachora maydis]